jgi:hypothetical protein
MGLLTDIIADASRRSAVVRDAERLLDEEVAEKSGFAGIAVKAAFGMVKTLKPGVIGEVCDGLLPEFASVLDPVLAKCPAGHSFASFVVANERLVVETLLAVTDRRAERSTHQTLVKAYEKLRPTAEKQVAAGLPRLGRLIEKHAALLRQAS